MIDRRGVEKPVREWPEEYGPYAPGYKPPITSKDIENREELRSEPTMKNLEVTPPKWKRRNVSAVRDFPPIPKAAHPHLSMERRLQIAAHMRCVADEDAAMAREEIRLLKGGTLRKGTRRHKAAFLLSIEKDLEAMIKDEEDPSEDDASDNEGISNA
jgi:hypothetical protein